MLQFTYGELLLVAGPEGLTVYGLFYEVFSSSACLAQSACRPRYERYPDPTP